MVLGSEIRDPEKTYSGSRGQKCNGSRIRIITVRILQFLLEATPTRLKLVPALVLSPGLELCLKINKVKKITVSYCYC
jgi:hypothetical protein